MHLSKAYAPLVTGTSPLRESEGTVAEYEVRRASHSSVSLAASSVFDGKTVFTF
jgi:hypothetical protein